MEKFTPSDQKRFWDKVDKTGTCWPWTGYKPDGYGRFRLNGRPKLAHRIAFLFSGGTIPEGLSVLHSCDNPACCNPAHLRTGTNADNMRDRSDRGRFRRPVKAHKDSVSGERCVYKLKNCDSWAVELQLPGGERLRACVPTKEEAIAQRKAWEEQYLGRVYSL